MTAEILATNKGCYPTLSGSEQKNTILDELNAYKDIEAFEVKPMIEQLQRPHHEARSGGGVAPARRRPHDAR